MSTEEEYEEIGVKLCMRFLHLLEPDYVTEMECMNCANDDIQSPDDIY